MTPSSPLGLTDRESILAAALGHMAMGARIDPSSYVDPNGFAFHLNGQVHRLIHGSVASFYRAMFARGIVEELISRHGLVRTEIAETAVGRTADLLLRHETIWPVTYPVEWCASMLRDAALLTLDLSSALAAHDCVLQDAYPWNILFRGAEPVHVDFTSIVSASPGLIWPAFDQFGAFFHRPLVLAANGKGRLARGLLYDNLRGVSAAEFMLHTTWRFKAFHPVDVAVMWAEALLQQSGSLRARARRAIDRSRAAVRPDVRRRFYSGVRRAIMRLRFPQTDRWSGYSDTPPGAMDAAAKRQSVATILGRLRPSTVLDLGANTGEFSVMAARGGARVVAIDESDACIERLYHKARVEHLPISPIVADILCPTPAFGFMSQQYPALTDRARCDVVLCLGLMHHLHVAGRQPFDRIVKLLRHLATRHLVFEFVDRTDENIPLIGSARTIDYTFESVRDALALEFGPCLTLPSDRTTRKLMVFGDA